jgi:anti-anti-sigma factor
MNTDRHKQGGVNVLTPRDALNEATLTEFQAALTDVGAPAAARLILDLTHVPFVDSAGIEMLLKVAGDPRAGATRARLTGLSETVREALTLTNTAQHFMVFDTVEAAVRSFL